jgi:HD superfamily phosphohydrolase YqeK
MTAYNHYRNCTDINKILDNINPMLTPAGMYTACHGRYHALFVVDAVETILHSLSYDARTIELGKIAAILHDVGNIAGRWNHARKSAALAAVLLDYPVNLLPAEKDMIIQAIADHSEGKMIASAVGAALLIADKIDVSKKRVLPVKDMDDWHRNLLEIEKVELIILDKEIIINYIITDFFSKDVFFGEYKKGFDLPAKAAAFLGCRCCLQFNGTEEII